LVTGKLLYRIFPSALTVANSDIIRILLLYRLKVTTQYCIFIV